MRKNHAVFMLILAAALCGFSLGAARREVRAAPLPPCSSYQCKTLFSWFTSENYVSAEDLDGTNTKTAVTPIYAPGPTGEKSPWISDGVNYNKRRWSQADFTCAKMNGQYPAPEEITPKGIKFTEILSSPPKNHCTPGNP